jgi:hypothetical protein
MATPLYLRNPIAREERGPHKGTADNDLAGAAGDWVPSALKATRGAGAFNVTRSSVAGATAGIEPLRSGSECEWISDPLDAAVTISGTITFNIWAHESSMNANAGAQVVIERLDNKLAVISTVVNSEKGTELGTSSAVQNWTAAATSTAFAKGDRIRVRIAFNDAGGTMASGFTLTATVGAASAGVSGDSFVSFTETLTFMAEPAGTVVYLTDTAGEIDPGGAGVDSKEMWTSRGSGSVDAVRDTAAGYTAPLFWTKTAGGNTIEWYSRKLTAFTLAGLVRANIRGLVSAVNTRAVVRAELAVVNADGSGAVIFGEAGHEADTELNTTDTAYSIGIAGPDISVTNEQRLRLRLYVDDETFALVTGRTATVTYSGATGGAAGDSFLTLPQSVTEFAGGGASVTPATIAAVASLPAAGPQAGASKTPTTISVPVATPQAQARASITLTPTTVPVLAAVPAAAPRAGVTLTPATVPTLAAVPQAGPRAGSEVTPATVAVIAALPQAQAGASITLTPETLAAIAALPQAGIQAGSSITPATIAALAALPQMTPQASVVLTPQAIAALVAVPQAGLQAGASVTPATIGALVALAQAVVQADVSVTPAVVPIVVATPQTNPQAGAAVTPATVALTVALAQATPRTDVVMTPATVAVLIAIPTPTVDTGSGNTTVTPATIAALVTVPQALAQAGVVVTPEILAAIAAIPQVTPQASVVLTPATIATLTAVPQAVIEAGAQITPATIAALVVIPQVDVSAGQVFAAVLTFEQGLLKWTLGDPELKWILGRPTIKWNQGPGEV